MQNLGEGVCLFVCFFSWTESRGQQIRYCGTTAAKFPTGKIDSQSENSVYFSVPTCESCIHRRTGNFLPGGAVNHLPKKIFQVAQIFTKESKRNEGHITTTQAVLAYEGGSIQFFRVNTKSEHKLRRHKQTFGKIATTVVLR